MPEIGDVVLNLDSEISETVCATQDPSVGGMLEVAVTTVEGNLEGISKVEFFIDQELMDTLEEPPFVFSVDTTTYEDETTLKLKVIVYDLDGEEFKSIGAEVGVDNSPEPSLKPLAEELGIALGTIVDHDDKEGYVLPTYDKDYFETICQNFQFIVAEYGMYMSILMPRQGVWDFSFGDQVINFAKENGKQIRIHPLIWGLDLEFVDPRVDWVATPLWIHHGNFSREEMIEIMYKHIETTMTHYKGRVHEWVVVNEPLGWYQKGSGIVMKDTIWTRQLGDDYVELAFNYARQVDPDAVLIINDVNVDYLGQYAPWDNRVEGFYLYVKDLVERGTPIDIVGFQFHWKVGEDHPTVDAIVDNFARYGELGLEVSISEMDVSIVGDVTPETLEEQARLYSIAMQACLESEYCTSFTVWGHSDKYNLGLIPGYQAPSLFDENDQPKPAFYSILEVMESYLEK